MNLFVNKAKKALIIVFRVTIWRSCDYQIECGHNYNIGDLYINNGYIQRTFG